MNNEKIISDEHGAVITEAVRQASSYSDKKFKDIQWLMIGVVVVTFIGFITMIVMVVTLIIDSFHFNSATYREYSEKISTLNSLKDSNKELLDQNKQNQQIIIDQLKQTQEFLKK